MKTHQHAHSSAGQEKYLKKQEKKLTFFCVTFAKGDRLRTLESSVSSSASSQSKNKHLSTGEGQKYT